MRRSVVAIGLVLGACGGAPSARSSTPASPAVAQFAGLWSGSYKLTSCSGERHCVLYVGTSRTFELRLQQAGGHVEGLFVAGALNGTLLHETTTPLGYDINVFGPVRITGDVVSSVRSDLASFAAVIDGTWSGRFAVRSCSPVLPDPYCYPFQEQEVSFLQLTVQRGGSALTGTLTFGSGRIPVSGAIAGGSFTIGGETLSAASGGDSLLRVTGFKGSIDAFGRMTGTRSYQSGYPVAAPRIGESAQLELRNVLKHL